MSPGAYKRVGAIGLLFVVCTADSIRGQVTYDEAAPTFYGGFITTFEGDFPVEAWDGSSLLQSGMEDANCHVTPGAGVDGSTAIRISGTDKSTDISYCYFTVFKVLQPVTEHMTLRYLFQPDNELSRHVAVDLIFSDNSTLRNSPAQDQNHLAVHPGTARGTVGQWSKIESTIGKWHSGKTIKAVVVAYDNGQHTGAFSAAIDNLEISTDSAEEQQEAIDHKQEILEARRNRMRPPVVIHSWPTVSAYQASVPSAQVVSDLPIVTDIKQAIGQCVWALTHSFDRDRDDEPFFNANRREDGYGEFYHAVAIGIPHVVGRSLWGAMLTEETTGIPFPSEALAIYTRYCKSSFDNEDHLNSYFDNGNRKVEFHNMREGLFGLVALMRGRQDEWARQEAYEMIRELEKLTDADGHWTVERARTIGMGDRVTGIGLDATTCGRIIDPLLHYYDFSKDPLALELAGEYARATLKTAFTSDGHFAPMKQSGGHIHSITSSLSGIAAYAIYTNNHEMLDRCRQIMEHGVPEYHSSWGWGDEVMPEHPANIISRGEINQTGDVIRTALLLGQVGDPEYYELAERYLRSMLLPTQHYDQELKAYLKDQPSPENDAERDIRQRVCGGYAMQLPNDRMQEGDWPLTTLDITSGAVHALCECYRHRVTMDGDIAQVNLLFDYEGNSLTVGSSLPKQGEIRFEIQKVKKLLVRIPSWVDRQSIRLTVDGEERKIEFDNGYLSIDGLKPDMQGCILFDVPVRIEKERVDGTDYTVTWVGSQVIDILPRGKISPLPF